MQKYKYNTCHRRLRSMTVNDMVTDFYVHAHVHVTIMMCHENGVFFLKNRIISFTEKMYLLS